MCLKNVGYVFMVIMTSIVFFKAFTTRKKKSFEFISLESLVSSDSQLKNSRKNNTVVYRIQSNIQYISVY
jgi:hypothetical protein